MAYFVSQEAADVHYGESLADLMGQARRLHDSVGGSNMKCEICGAKGGLYGGWILCDEHSQGAADCVGRYVESLNPPFNIEHGQYGYLLTPRRHPYEFGDMKVRVENDVAEALYEYIRNERGTGICCPKCGDHTVQTDFSTRGFRCTSCEAEW